MMTYEEVRGNKDINTYIVKADQYLKSLGFTEHSFSHVTRVAETADYILRELDYSPRERELAKIAGYMHDIGNIVNRVDHAQSGAVMSFRILDRLGVDPEDIADIIAAIGNHDEGTGAPVSAIAAALILGDKSDVRYTRVRNRDFATFDIHDRVNFSVKNCPYFSVGVCCYKIFCPFILSLNLMPKNSAAFLHIIILPINISK